MAMCECSGNFYDEYILSLHFYRVRLVAFMWHHGCSNTCRTTRLIAHIKLFKCTAACRWRPREWENHCWIDKFVNWKELESSIDRSLMEYSFEWKCKSRKRKCSSHAAASLRLQRGRCESVSRTTKTDPVFFRLGLMVHMTIHRIPLWIIKSTFFVNRRIVEK